MALLLSCTFLINSFHDLSTWLKSRASRGSCLRRRTLVMRGTLSLSVHSEFRVGRVQSLIQLFCLYRYASKPNLNNNTLICPLINLPLYVRRCQDALQIHPVPLTRDPLVQGYREELQSPVPLVNSVLYWRDKPRTLGGRKVGRWVSPSHYYPHT